MVKMSIDMVSRPWCGPDLFLCDLHCLNNKQEIYLELYSYLNWEFNYLNNY